MKTTSRASFIPPPFAKLPRDYLRLCQLLLPRPIHSRTQAAEVEAMIDSLAVDERRLSADQRDYLEMLNEVLTVWDEARSPAAADIAPAALLQLLLEASGQTAAAVARSIGVDRSVMTRLLNGSRSFTVPQAKALAAHFAVAPAAFLDLSKTPSSIGHS
ncbi:MAG: family transcriptional regulator [Prosthecobacter sp.]|nr:family transcriptional regulator [Prosthecobacter sp.]